MISNGKRFEQNIRASCKKQGIWWERFIDGNKFGGGESEIVRFTPDSPCDGFIFSKGHLIYLELKTAQTGSISFNKPLDVQPKGKAKPSIKSHQVKSLLERREYDGILAGLLIEFSDRQTKTKIVKGGCYYIAIEDFCLWAKSCDKKSINVSDAMKIGIPITAKLLKTNKRYDIQELLDYLGGAYRWALGAKRLDL